MFCAVLALCRTPVANPPPGFARLFFAERNEGSDAWIYAASNTCTAAAMFAMALVLFQVMRKKNDHRLHGAAILAGSFFTLRAATQLLSIWVQYHPAFRLRWEWNVVISVLAVGMAVSVVWLLPVLHRLPSITDLEAQVEQRRRAEEEAIAKEERFRAFVESVEDYAIYMLDAEGTVLSWNHGAERVKGYSAEEIVGQNFARFFTSEDRAAGVPEKMLQISRDSGSFRGEGWRVRKDGSQFLANVVMRPIRDSSGAVSGFSKVTRDLTESRELETRFQMLLEAVPNAIVIANRLGNVEYVNTAAEELFGFERAEIAGQPVAALVPPEHREKQGGFLESILGKFDDALPSASNNCYGLRKDGAEFPLEYHARPLQTREGGVVLFAIQDLTERKRAADLLAQNVLALRMSNEALEQFAHIASHDLQEPLRMVASYLQLLSRRYKGKLDRDADEFIDFAVDGTHRMKRLIEDLLKYSRVGRNTPRTRLHSENALREALGNLHAAIEASGANITWDALPEVTGEEVHLVQLFQNLVGNAIKYRGELTPQIHVSAKTSDAGWIFSVADNGIGIEAQYFDRIFSLFQRLHGHQEYEGTGIGLAICKRILQHQGGRIWVESTPGAGSTFYFELPSREQTDSSAISPLPPFLVAPQPSRRPAL